jgi:hypothetical protein
VWDQDGELFLWTSATVNPGSPTLLPPSPSTEGDMVPVTTSDEVVREERLHRVDFIKMDVEGAESNALCGAAETLRRLRPRIGMGPEHTGDVFANNERVIDTVRSIEASCQYEVTESHPSNSPSRGSVLTPYSLYFSVRSS